ncbi:MAG: bifunctional PIG-L family deacetylase/class I SAM-dependent methyltransferase [Marmoricola sp.]
MRLVVLAAHPDDESLGAGGLISTAVASGLEVVIVCATDGEHSHPDSPTCTPAELAVIRSREGRAAATALGVTELHRLELPDGGLEAHEDLVVTKLVDLVGDGRQTVIAAPWRSDGHPDHETAGRAAAAAARRTGADLWEYPVWFWHWGTPDEAPWQSLHPFALEGGALAAKAAAIRAHLSQVAPLSALQGDETLLGPELLAHFADSPEHFLCTPSEECPDDSLDRLHLNAADPWGADSRWYEQRKRDLVLAALPKPSFDRTLELGCSTGALAEALAGRSRQVVAVDRSSAALAAARRRLVAHDGVRVARLDLPREWVPDLSFDLVVVSEMGYFLSPAALEQLVDRVVGSLDPQGVVVLCHWRHRVEGWVLDADRVHAAFEDPRLPPLRATYRDRDVEIRVHARDDSWPDPLR